MVRKEFECNLGGDVFLTPFEIFNLYLSITVQSIVLDPNQNDGKNINIKFNCMNTEKVSTIDTGEHIDYGSYTLASHFLDSDYSKTASHRFSQISVVHPGERIKVSNK